MSSLSKYITLSSLILLVLYNSVYAECTLSTLPSPPIQNWITNVETVISEAKKLSTADTKCEKPAGYPSRLDIAIPIRSVQLLTGYMQAAGYDVSTLLSDVRFYFDNAGPLIRVEQDHQNSILEIQKKIMITGVYIGSRCTQSIQFTSDIAITGSSYKTKGKTIQQVLGDLSGQNTEVLKFFRNLIKNIQSREYIDETKFLIAPKGFAQDMQKFYSVEAIQQCHDEEPKNVAIKEAVKKAFSIGWKYPQAIQVWKDAFALLRYRGAQISGSSASDSIKDAQINNLVQAQKGGIGNSRFLLNSGFFKEFGRRGGSETILEQIKATGKKIAHELYGPIFQRQVIEDTARASPSPVYTNLATYAEYDQNARELAELDRANYDAYAMRKIFVGQNKDQDPKTVTGLVQALEYLEKARPTVEENMNKACKKVLDKQAKNTPRSDCNTLMKA